MCGGEPIGPAACRRCPDTHRCHSFHSDLVGFHMTIFLAIEITAGKGGSTWLLKGARFEEESRHIYTLLNYSNFQKRFLVPIAAKSVPDPAAMSRY